MASSVLTPEEVSFLDRILNLIADPEIDRAGERNVLATALAGAEARGALRKQGELQRVLADMSKVLDAVSAAAAHDQLASAFVQVAHQQGGQISGEMVANLITQLVRTRAELIQALSARAADGSLPTMVFGHLPATPEALEHAFHAFDRMRQSGTTERGAFDMAIAALLQSEPERPAPATAS